jgi:hypothetical protein
MVLKMNPCISDDVFLFKRGLIKPFTQIIDAPQKNIDNIKKNLFTTKNTSINYSP